MIMNIWDYQGISEKVKLETKDGKVYTGSIISILDADDLEANEPQLSIETSDGIYGIWESEIQNMEVIK